MASAGIANLRMFKPGQSGNPGGRPKLPEELKTIHAHSPVEVSRVISKYARMSFDELKEILTSKSRPVLELAVAKLFMTIIEAGDHSKLSFLLDRCIGKVPEMVETDDDSEAREELKKLSLNELLNLVQSNLPEAG